MARDSKTKVRRVIDEIAGAGTSQKLEGKAHEASGKAKRVVGIVTDNKDLETEGQMEVGKGRSELLSGEVTAAVHQVQEAVARDVKRIKKAIATALMDDDSKQN